MHRIISFSRNGRISSIHSKANLRVKNEISVEISENSMVSSLSILSSSRLSQGMRMTYLPLRCYADPGDKIKEKEKQKREKAEAEKKAKAEEEKKEETPAAAAASGEVKKKKKAVEEKEEEVKVEVKEEKKEEVTFDPNSVDYNCEAVALVYRLNLLDVVPDYRLNFDELTKKIDIENRQLRAQYGELRVEMENKLRAKKSKGKGSAAPAQTPKKSAAQRESYDDEDSVVEDTRVWDAITEDDTNGNKSSLYRALNHFLYLVVEKDGKFQLPKSIYSKEDKADLQETAKRATSQLAGKNLDVHFLGHAPFHFSETASKNLPKPKTRTWYFEAIYRFGTPQGKYQWLTKKELEQHLSKEEFAAVAPALVGLSDSFPQEEIDRMLERKQLFSAE